MQEGLKHDVMKASAVSRAANYKELCIANKNEGRRHGNLGLSTPQGSREMTPVAPCMKPAEKTSNIRRCYRCHKDGLGLEHDSRSTI